MNITSFMSLCDGALHLSQLVSEWLELFGLGRHPVLH